MHTLFAQQQALLKRSFIKQPILAFHPVKAGQWQAELVCGHRHLLIHHPPFHSRPWLLSPTLRRAMVGCLLPCKACSDSD